MRARARASLRVSAGFCFLRVANGSLLGRRVRKYARMLIVVRLNVHKQAKICSWMTIALTRSPLLYCRLRRPLFGAKTARVGDNSKADARVRAHARLSLNVDDDGGGGSRADDRESTSKRAGERAACLRQMASRRLCDRAARSLFFFVLLLFSLFGSCDKK